ncbi:secreted antigen 1 [Babesia divergens]|uniref:Secreted antigen 1 n=1 Tax=Babesia divergens TaxID=32595 RepID=A0AAD9GHJ1_BABDI|nr:secreted antigen 1 [Babesia divergens]
MKFLGILRVSTLFILASAFQGPREIFCSNLKVNPSTEVPTVEVSEVSENHEDSTVESSSQSDLVFKNSKWDDSQLASTVLLLEEFCKEVRADKFKKEISDANIMEVSWTCLSVSSYTKFLSDHSTVIYGPGSVAERNEIPRDFYEGKLKPEDFEVYVKWIVGNMPVIKKSYNKMLEESAKLTEEQLKSDNPVGPNKYGFVFTGERWNAILPQRSHIEDDSAPNLLVSLDKLQKCLKRVLKRSTVESPLVKEAEGSPVRSQDAVAEDRKEPHDHSDFSKEFNSEHDGKEPIKEAEMSNEEHEQHDVARKTETDVTSDPSTINLSGSFKNPDGSTATPSSNGAAEDMEADREGLLKRISDQRKELVERLSKSDAPYSLEDMKHFYCILRDEADVNPEAVQKVGKKIHTFLGNFGIHGEDAKGSLEVFMEMMEEYVMGLFSSTKQLSNEERAEMRKTVAEILEQLPKSHVNTQANDYDASDN